MRIRIAHVALTAALLANLILAGGCGKSRLDRRISGQVEISDTAGNRVPLMISQIRIVPVSVAEEAISQWQRWSALQMMRALDIQSDAVELEAHAILRAEPDLHNPTQSNGDAASTAAKAVKEIQGIVGSVRAYRSSKAPLSSVSLFHYLNEHLNSNAMITAKADTDGSFSMTIPASAEPVALVTEASESLATEAKAYVWIIQIPTRTNHVLLTVHNSVTSGSDESLARIDDVPTVYLGAALMSAEDFKSMLNEFHQNYADWLQTLPDRLQDPNKFVQEPGSVYAQIIVPTSAQSDRGPINLNVGDYIHVTARSAKSVKFELNGTRGVVPLSATDLDPNR